MEELVTEAIVLESKARWNGDRQVSLFTKELGKVEAKATSGMKTSSKLSPHLDVLNLSQVRLVAKNNYLITDALTKTRFKSLRKEPELVEKTFEIFSIIKLMAPSDLKDLELWYYLISGLNKLNLDSRTFLKILGYNPMLANCFICNKRNVSYFIPSDQSFVCQRCAEKIDNSKLFAL